MWRNTQSNQNKKNLFLLRYHFLSLKLQEKHKLFKRLIFTYTGDSIYFFTQLFHNLYQKGRVFIPLELYVSSRSHPTETIPRPIFRA